MGVGGAGGALEEGEAVAGEAGGVAGGALVVVAELSYWAECAGHFVVVGGLSFVAGGEAGGVVEVVEVGGGAVEAVVAGWAGAGEAGGVAGETEGGVGGGGAGGEALGVEEEGGGEARGAVGGGGAGAGEAGEVAEETELGGWVGVVRAGAGGVAYA